MNVYDLTPPQVSIYGMGEYAGGAIDNISASIMFEKDVSATAIEYAVNEIIKFNDAMRIRIVKTEEVKQCIDDFRALELEELYFDEQSDFNTWAEECAGNSCKENNGMLYQFKIIKIKQKRGLFLKIHHIISDAWTVSKIFSMVVEFSNEYDIGLYERGTRDFPSYISYINKSKAFIDSNRYQKDREYWNGKLKECSECVTLSLSNGTSLESERLIKNIDADFTKEIKELNKELNVSEYCLFMTILGLYLNKVSRKKQFYIGTTFLNREGVQEKNTLGMFIASQALYMSMESETFIENLIECRKNIFEGMRHQKYTYTEVLKQLEDTENEKLYDVTLNYQNAVISNLDQDYSLEWYHCKSQLESLDIHIYERKDGSLRVIYDYQIDKYKEWEVNYIHEHIISLLREVLKNPYQKISDMNYINENEMRLLENFNMTEFEYDRNETIISKFEKQVEATPNNVAVVFEDESITYDELNRKANQFARKIKQIEVNRDDFIAIIAERSIEMIIGIYGILKANCAYVPIDPSYPEERIQYILSDCNPKLVVIYQSDINTDIPVLELSCDFEGDDTNLEQKNTSSDLAYCIFTSGTTGKPKGVMVENRSLINMITAYTDIYSITSSDVILQFASFSFDQSIWDIFNATLVGATLCMMRNGLYSNLEEFKQYVKEKGVTVAALTPAYISECNPEDFPTLRMLESGGDQARAEVLKKWSESKEIYNTYGPTEATVNAITYKFSRECCEKAIPIGKPIYNTKLFLINNDELCGIGIPGELCIAGDGLARGYLNKPELTEEKFSKTNKFTAGRIYHTGDLARWLPDGNIEYLGRIDKQVKIRGFRIELGEIENVICKIEKVREACVVAQKDRSNELALYAYVIHEEDLDLASIRNEMAKDLPEYMIPVYMMSIESLPLNNNGKLDVKALPEILVQSEREYLPPRDEIEEMICSVYEQVLNVDRVGISDNFFSLGGHSIKVTKAINIIESETGVRILIKEVFQNPSPEQLANVVKNKDKQNESITKSPEKKYYAMSSVQKRLYIINEMDKNGVSYNMPAVIHMNEEIDITRINYALNELIKRYETLRTRFLMINGEAVQKIESEVISRADLHQICEEDKENYIREFIQPFLLEESPLIRVKALVTEKNNYILIDMHHIISDGMSCEIYIRDFVQLYKGNKLEEIPLQYKDYSEWMNQRDLSRQENYWLSVFEVNVPVLELPLDYHRPKLQSFEGNTLKTEISRDLVEQIENLTTKTGITEYMIMLSSAMILLSKYSRQEDIVIGTPVSGRSHNNMENMVGMFVNTVVMRGQPQPDKTIIDFFDEMKNVCLKAYENEDYPFEELVDKIITSRELSRNPIFDVMFSFEEDFPEIEGIKITDAENSLRISKFDLTITVKKGVDSYVAEFEYCTKLFKKETIERMMLHFKKILMDIVEDTKKRIRDISLVTNSEIELIMKQFNQTKMAYETYASVIQMFEKQVRKTPKQYAVVYKDEKITYEELNRKANVIGKRLRSLGVKPNDFVAIISEKNIDMIVGILGIIKAGGCYVPISKGFPQERVNYILNDCSAKVLVTYRLDESLRNIQKDIPIIQLEYVEYQTEEGFEDLEIVNKYNDIVYSIYTSGTTGKPKGVMIEHKSLLNLVYAYTDIYEMTENDIVLQFANISFDQSVLEIFNTLLIGAQLCVVPEEYIEDLYRFEEYIVENKVTWLGLTPAYLKELNPDKLTSIRMIESGGATAEIDVLRKWLKKAVVFNTYGPTETTVNATSYRFDNYDEEIYSLPIGKPMYNTQVYILDHEQLCGIGVIGELCIAGEGVARGYINRDDLDRKKFIPNPFGEGKLYRSGDLARWLPDGNIECLGRVDDQVKIRGFRIELGEIESVIRNTGIVEDVVVVVASTDKQSDTILAYLVSSKEIDVDKLKDNLRDELPSYMVPAHLMQIDKIPVTSNGKVDRNALPTITVKQEDNYIAPVTEAEVLIVRVFQEVLDLERIGIKDNFFELGGDSIKAIRAVSKLRELGYETSIKNIMKYKDIETIASNIRRDHKNVINQEELSGEVLMLPIQLDFFENHFEEEYHYNQAMLLKANETLDINHLIKVMNSIIEKHDILRSVFKNNRQFILGSNESLLHMEIVELRDVENAQKLMELKNSKIQKGFNLEEGPLVKVCLYHMPDSDYLFLCIHHLVVDGVSWRIIVDDIENAYGQCKQNLEVKLPQKTSSYNAWAKSLREYAKKPELLEEYKYWKEVCQRALEWDLPKSSFANLTYNRKDLVMVQMDEKVTGMLINEANRAYSTRINDLLLTSLAMAVNEWTKQEQICIELESHGREEIDDDIVLDRTVGWFTNIYPVILNTGGSIEEQIIRTKEMFRQIKRNGIGYGVLCNFSSKSLPKVKPEICFNYLGINDIEQNNGIFSLEQYSSKDDISDRNHLENGISINSFVSESIMKIEITYNADKYSKEDMNYLGLEYKTALEKVTYYCCNQKENVKTLSDFGLLDVEESEMDDVLSFLETL